MIAGDAPHLETFFLSHKYGRPKDQDAAAERPPILSVTAYWPPGSYDPLARATESPVKADVIAYQRSMPAGITPDLPRGTTAVSGHRSRPRFRGRERGGAGQLRSLSRPGLPYLARPVPPDQNRGLSNPTRRRTPPSEPILAYRQIRFEPGPFEGLQQEPLDVWHSCRDWTQSWTSCQSFLPPTSRQTCAMLRWQRRS